MMMTRISQMTFGLGIALAMGVETEGAVLTVLSHDGAGVLQSDHFEGDTVGNAPSQWSNTSTPIVRDSGTNPPGSVPGGAENTDSTNFVELQAGDEITDSFAALGSGTLTANFALWNEGDGATGFSRFRVKFLESDLAGIVGQIGFDDNGNVEGTSLTYTVGAWNNVTFSVDLDSGNPHQITVTVNGASETINMLNDNDIGGFEFASRLSGGHTVFIDAQFVAVPEPSTLALLGFGGLACFCMRRQSPQAGS